MPKHLKGSVLNLFVLLLQVGNLCGFISAQQPGSPCHQHPGEPASFRLPNIQVNQGNVLSKISCSCANGRS